MKERLPAVSSNGNDKFESPNRQDIARLQAGPPPKEGSEIIEALLKRNAGLIRWCVNRLQPTPELPAAIDKDDLYQEASLELIEAAHRFNEETGVRFSAFASNRMWWRIMRMLREGAQTIRFPKRMHPKLKEYEKVTDELVNVGVKATDNELAEKLRIPEKIVRQRRAQLVMANPPLSLEIDGGLNPHDQTRWTAELEPFLRQPAEDNPVGEVCDEIASLQEQDHIKTLAQRVLSSDTLTALEKEILMLRAGLGVEPEKALTLREIGEMHGVSKQAIAKAERKALEKARAVLTALMAE